MNNTTWTPEFRMGRIKEFGEKARKFSRRLLARLQKYATLNDENKFHFDKFARFGGLWYQRLESYLPSTENDRNGTKTSEERRKKSQEWRVSWTKLWCAFIAFGFLLPCFLRILLFWFWQSDSGTFWLHNIAVVIGGRPEYHIGPLFLWAIQAIVWTAECWRVQANGQIGQVLEPFIAIHYPEAAKRIG